MKVFVEILEEYFVNETLKEKEPKKHTIKISK
jgi:hypothetical protein